MVVFRARLYNPNDRRIQLKREMACFNAEITLPARSRCNSSLF